MPSRSLTADVPRPYTYFYRPIRGKGWWVAATRQEWLDAIELGVSRPKPPEWWLQQQEREGRTRTSAAIIWSRNYGAARKIVIWGMAEDEDFRKLEYLT